MLTSIMELPKYYALPLVLTITSILKLADALVCLSCQEAVKPRDCPTVEHCGSHSYCFMDQLLTEQGSIRYNLGCRDSLQCPSSTAGRSLGANNASVNIDSGNRARRSQQLMCRQCCDTTLCNNAGCLEKGYPDHHGPICYACPSSQSPRSCNTVKVCGRDEGCYIGQYTMGTDTLFTMDCLGQTKCISKGLMQAIPLIVGRETESHFNLSQAVEFKRPNRDTTSGEHCCDLDLCNHALPVDGHWTGWSLWGSCSATCGGLGYRTRSRTCTNPPPTDGGNQCQGTDVDNDRTCANFACPNELVCLSCNGAATPRACNLVEKCGSHSVCFLEKYVTANGYPTFYSGCRDKLACGKNTNGKRFLAGMLGGHLTCAECCTGNLCNSAGCGLPGYPYGIGPICYSCNQQLNPYQCDTIDICQQGQACHHDTSCPRCCDTDLCNKDACTAPTTTINPPQPVITTIQPAVTNPHQSVITTVHPAVTNPHQSVVTTIQPVVTTMITAVPFHWASWSPWSVCSATCGAGVKIRSRSCQGAGCVGNFKETGDCEMVVCANPEPVDGAWGQWQPWGPCDRVDYTTGSMERMRICDSPFPTNGGQPCPNAPDFIDIDKTWCLGSQTPHCTGTKIDEIRVDGTWTVGGTVSLQCKASGDPLPQIHWTIHTEENVHRFPEDPATIILVGIKKAHAGNFTCSASNNCGHVARKIYVARIP